MQMTEVRAYETPRALSASHRAGLGGGASVPAPPAMAQDRARLRRPAPRRPQPPAPTSNMLAWVALALLFTALMLALAFGQLGGALGLLLGWLSAAFVFLARRELLVLLERAAR